MTREEYDRESERLLREFAKVYDRNGPGGGHYSEAARQLSAAITRHASNFRPEWYARR